MAAQNSRKKEALRKETQKKQRKGNTAQAEKSAASFRAIGADVNASRSAARATSRTEQCSSSARAYRACVIPAGRSGGHGRPTFQPAKPAYFSTGLDTPLGRRLAMVQAQVGVALDRCVPGCVRAISVCAGQGHDLIGVLVDHPRRTYEGAVPANLVLLCGVFGNISAEDITNTVSHLRRLCAPQASLIWTRHRHPPDLTPYIRETFERAGFDELCFRGFTAIRRRSQPTARGRLAS